MTKPDEGWEGWDEYAPFYDWENARTLGRRDVPFWRRVAARGGRAGARARLRHRPHLAAARARRRAASSASIDRRRCSRAPRRGPAPDRSNCRGPFAFVRGDIRSLPFKRGTLRDGARAVRRSAVAAPRARSRPPRSSRSRACSRRGGTFGIDLVPDVPNWREYANRVQLVGPARGGGASDAHRIGPPGSRAPAHDLRAAVRRAPRAAARPSTASS